MISSGIDTDGDHALEVLDAATGNHIATLTLGREPGTNTVSARVAELYRVSFTAIGVAVPRSLTRISGDGEQAGSGASLSEPFAFAGATVTFAVTAGAGTLSTTTAATDANGRAPHHPDFGEQTGNDYRRGYRGRHRPSHLHRHRGGHPRLRRRRRDRLLRLLPLRRRLRRQQPPLRPRRAAAASTSATSSSSPTTSGIRPAASSFAGQMQAPGLGEKTFRFETDDQGEPLVHRQDGQHPDSHPLGDTLSRPHGHPLPAATIKHAAILI